MRQRRQCSSPYAQHGLLQAAGLTPASSSEPDSLPASAVPAAPQLPIPPLIAHDGAVCKAAGLAAAPGTPDATCSDIPSSPAHSLSGGPSTAGLDAGPAASPCTCAPSSSAAWGNDGGEASWLEEAGKLGTDVQAWLWDMLLQLHGLAISPFLQKAGMHVQILEEAVQKLNASQASLDTCFCQVPVFWAGNIKTAEPHTPI